MFEPPSVRRLWVIQYVNGSQFFGRFNGHWTRTRDLDVAALFASESEAENARQALHQEAKDRLERSKESWPEQIWWDIVGGCVIVAEVEQITRLAVRRAAPGMAITDSD